MLNLDRHFFPVFDSLDPAIAYPGTYNLRLVATSVAIAILAAAMRPEMAQCLLHASWSYRWRSCLTGARIAPASATTFRS